MNAWTEAATFAESWHRSVRRGPNDIFLIFEGPQQVTRWSYREFDDLVQRTGGYLRDHGVVAGSSVHLALANSPAFVALWLATNCLGATIVPSDPFGASPELAGHIERTRPTIGFCAHERADVYRQAAGSMPFVTLHEHDPELASLGTQTQLGWPTPQPRDRAAVLFTSGTTGRPKGVQITQANYAFTGATMAAAANLEAQHRQLVVLPMFHANAQYYSVSSAIWQGASVALMHTFSASGFLAQAARHQATHASLFAAPIRMILSRGAAPVSGLRLVHCWYAMNISDDQYLTLSNLLGCQPRQLYGMTETIPAVLTDDASHPVPSSMGFVTPGCKVQLQRADGSVTDDDEVGEIVVGGTSGITLFDGYLDDPITTQESFRNGWFCTADRATRSAAGRYSFNGRRADVLKVAGENVSTVEVEQVLSAHPGILEAAVVGMPDALRDEVPVAFVVANDPALAPSAADLHEWCAAHLTKAKRPRDISFVDELPRTSVGKIRKFLLKDPQAEGVGA